MEEEVEDLESQDGVLARRERWIGALQGAQGQMPETATGGDAGGLLGGARLGQPSAARLGTGSPAQTRTPLKPEGGGRLAPARAPIGKKQDMAPATSIPRPTIGSTSADRLSPVRPPVKIDAAPD